MLSSSGNFALTSFAGVKGTRHGSSGFSCPDGDFRLSSLVICHAHSYADSEISHTPALALLRAFRVGSGAGDSEDPPATSQVRLTEAGNTSRPTVRKWKVSNRDSHKPVCVK